MYINNTINRYLLGRSFRIPEGNVQPDLDLQDDKEQALQDTQKSNFDHNLLTISEPVTGSSYLDTATGQGNDELDPEIYPPPIEDSLLDDEDEEALVNLI